MRISGDEDHAAAQAGEDAQLPGEMAESVDDAAARWARCVEIAGPPAVRSRAKIEAAYETIKQTFYDSPCQIQKRQDVADARFKGNNVTGRQRRRFHVFLKETFGHHNGVFDYLETGEMPPLHCFGAAASLPLSECVVESDLGPPPATRRRLS